MSDDQDHIDTLTIAEQVDAYNTANGADVREDISRYKRYEQDAEQLDPDGTPEQAQRFRSMARLLNAVTFEAGKFAGYTYIADDPTFLGDMMSLIPVYGTQRFRECRRPECTEPIIYIRVPSGAYAELDLRNIVGSVHQHHFHPYQDLWVTKAERKPIYTGSRDWHTLTGRGSPRRATRYWLWVPESCVGPFHDLDEASQVILTWRTELQHDWFAEGHGRPDIGNIEIPTDPEYMAWLTRREAGEVSLGEMGFDQDTED